MADSKVTALVENTTPALTDLLYIIDDPGGSPAGQKVTLANIGTVVSGLVKIEEQSPSGVAVVTFSALGAYSHLKIIYSARGDQAATSSLINLTFNADTGSNYDAQRSGFNTGTILSDQVAQTSGIIGAVTAGTGPASYPSSGEILIPDYRGTTFFKTATSQIAGPITAVSSGSILTRLHSVWWRNTAAITSIELTLNGGNYVAGSKFTLYGLK